MLKELINLANHLDKKGLKKEADYLDGIIRKTAKNEPGDALDIHFSFSQSNNSAMGWSVGAQTKNLWSEKEVKRLRKGKEPGIVQTQIRLAEAASRLISQALNGLDIKGAEKGTRLRFLWNKGEIQNQSGTGLDDLSDKIIPTISRALSGGSFSDDILLIDMLKQKDPE